MLSLPLLVTTLALAPTGTSLRFDVYAAGHFDYLSADAGNGFRNVGGRGGLGLTLYLHRLVDDDAPPSLQSFLQRTPELHLDGGGGSSQSSWTDPVPHLSYTSGWADLELHGYPGRGFYAGVHAGVEARDERGALYAVDGVVVPATGSTLALPVDAALGVRWRELLVTAGWGVTPARDDGGGFHVPFWGGARASVSTVLERRLSLQAAVIVLENGAGAGADAALYLRRRFGVTASIKGGHQSHTDATGFAPVTSSLDYVGFGVGLSLWASANLRADVRYDFEWDARAVGDASPSSASYYSTLRLGIGFRR